MELKFQSLHCKSKTIHKATPSEIRIQYKLYQINSPTSPRYSISSSPKRNFVVNRSRLKTLSGAFESESFKLFKNRPPVVSSLGISLESSLPLVKSTKIHETSSTVETQTSRRGSIIPSVGLPVIANSVIMIRSDQKRLRRMS